jgi:hypothetical protein
VLAEKREEDLMTKQLMWVTALIVGTSLVAQAEEPEPVNESALARFELRVSADEAVLREGVQRLRGHVRADVLTREGDLVLTVRAKEAERSGQALTMRGDVRVEAPEGARGAGLESLLEAHGLQLEEARVTAERVQIDLEARTIEVHGFDAEARATHEGRDPRITVRAERVTLGLDAEGAWRSWVTRPRAGLRFD